MQSLQKSRWPRHVFSLLPLWLLLGLLLNGCGGSTWPYPCEANPGPSPVSDLAVVDQFVYQLSSGTQSLVALRASDGAVQWRDSAPAWASLTGENERIYYLNYSSLPGSLSALRASDGKLLWSKSTNGNTVLQAANGSVYLAQQGEGRWQFMALNGSNGSARWTIDLASFDSLQSVDGVVYLLDGQGHVHAVRAETGAPLWQTSLDQVTLYPEPQIEIPPYARLEVVQGVVFVRTDQLYALRASDGHMLWHVPLVADGTGALLPSFAVANGMVYLSLHGHLAALRASDGKPVWQKLEPADYGYLAVTSGVLYASAGILLPGQINSSPLYAFQASTGHLLWSFNVTQHPVYIRALASQGSILYLLISSQANWHEPAATLMALQGTTRKTLWQHSVGATALLLDRSALYAGFAGNSTSPCALQNTDQLTKFDVNNGSLIWHEQLEPSPLSH